MNGIEFSTWANLMSNQNPHIRSGNGSLKTVKIQMPIYENFDSANMSINGEASQYDELHFEHKHYRKNLDEPPDYLFPSLGYKNFSSVRSTSGPTTTTTNTKKTPSSASYKDDFILISEFSEIEGPRPLLTIPSDGGMGFDKNDFALHLMCVDFHSHFNKEQKCDPNSPETAGGSKFSLTKDTSLVNYWDSNLNMVTACVQHFNLYDLDARGFVRPFCIAYVSFEHKPIGFFELIKTRFAEITSIFKRSNYNLFKLELEQRCADLQYTREFFLKWCSSSPEENDKATEKLSLDARIVARLNSSSSGESSQQTQLAAIDSLTNEMKSVLDVVKYELKAKNWLRLDKDENSSENLLSNNGNNEKKCYSAIDPLLLDDTEDEKVRSNRSFTYPFDPNCQLTVNVSHHHHHDHHHKKKRKYVLQKPKLFTNVLVSNSSSGGKILFSLESGQPSCVLKKMKRLHQLCKETAKKAINRLRLMHRYLSTPYYLLKFNDLTQAKRHKDDRFHLYWSMTFGDCLIGDFSSSWEYLEANINTFGGWQKKIAKKSSNNSLETTAQFNFHTQLSNCDNQLNRKNVSKEINSSIGTSTLSTTKNLADSVATQFYSPVGSMHQAQTTATGQAVATNNTSNNPTMYFDVNSNMNTFSSAAADTSWKLVEKIATSDRDDVDETIAKKIQQPTFDSGSSSSDEDEHFLYENENQNNEDTNDEDEEDDDDEDEEKKCAEQKEENEYDFLNSLLTVDYKSNNFTQNPTNLLALSLSSSSLALYYKCLNQLNYRSNMIDKLIQIAEFNFEETLRTLVNTHSNIFPHLLYSLLKGRPIVCVSRYCADLQYLQSLLDCLSNLLPNSFYCLNSLLDQSTSSRRPFTSSPNKTASASNDTLTRAQLKLLYKRKPVKLNDLKYCKLFGVCLLYSKNGQCCSHDCNENLNPNKPRSTIHQHRHYHMPANGTLDDDALLLKYIPITVRNYVSIFDLDKLTFLGPKYSGSFLFQCVNKAKCIQQDSTLYLFLLNHVFRYYVRFAYLYANCLSFKNDRSRLGSSVDRKPKCKSITKQTDNQEYLSKSIQYDDQSKQNSRRKFSYQVNATSSQVQTQSSVNIKADRMLNYFNTIMGKTDSANSTYSSASSILSLFNTTNAPIARQTSLLQHQQQLSNLNMDVDILNFLLRTVMGESGTVAGSSLPPTAANMTLNPADYADFYIVAYLLKTLKIKQLFMANLTLHKRKLKSIGNKANERSNKTASQRDDESQTLVKLKDMDTADLSDVGDQVVNNDGSSSSSSVIYMRTEIQYPLLIDYDELTLFSSKK